MQSPHGPIGSLIPNKPITIVGAGISGLLMGYFLKKQNLEFQILEKEKIPGGKIGTKKNEFGLAEKSANAIFSNDDVIELLEELNIPILKADRSLKKFVWRGDKASTPPIKKSEILKTLPKLLKQHPVDEGISIKDFLTPLLGKKLCDEVVAPGLGGIYAHDIKDLHFESIFKNKTTKKSNYLSFLLDLKKNRKKQKNKATSISFEGGMQALINRLKESLSNEIKLSSKVEALDGENIILCTNAHEAADILKGSHPEVSDKLLAITYKSVSTATLITSTPISFLHNSFGVLFPPDSKKFYSLGILSNSEIYPKRTATSSLHSYTFIVKGTNDIENKVEKDLSSICEISSLEGKKSLTVTSWSSGIPLYDLKRFQNIRDIRSLFLDTNPGLVLFGNYIDGISIREILSMAKNFAIKTKT